MEKYKNTYLQKNPEDDVNVLHFFHISYFILQDIVKALIYVGKEK